MGLRKPQTLSSLHFLFRPLGPWRLWMERGQL